MELSIILPCLNEEETLRGCILKAIHFIESENIKGEVIVADNGSTDNSVQIAQTCGVKVIHIEEKGYGSAIIGGACATRGKYIIMADSDGTYDLENLNPFLHKLREGYDLVIGNRFKGGIKANSMPLLHRYLGNPVHSFLGRILFKTSIGDFHCGLRGFTKKYFHKANFSYPRDGICFRDDS